MTMNAQGTGDTENLQSAVAGSASAPALGKRLTKWLTNVNTTDLASWFDDLLDLKWKSKLKNSKPIEEAEYLEASRLAVSELIMRKKLVPKLRCQGAAVEYTTPEIHSGTPQPMKEDDDSSMSDEEIVDQEPFLFRVETQPERPVDFVDVAPSILNLIEPEARTLVGSARKLFERRTIQCTYKDAWDNAYFDPRKHLPAGTKRRGRHNFIVGNPGIGKSWSLLYLLQLALSQGDMVLFTSAKSYSHWLFLPDTSSGMRSDARDNGRTGSSLYEGGYTVFRWASSGDDDLHKILPRLEACVWIVDPAEFKQGKPLHQSIDDICSFANLQARLFTALSDNPSHVGNLFEKYSNWAQYCADMWTWEELQHIPPDFFSINPDQLKNRFRVVGGSLRYLNDDRSYDSFVVRMNNVKVNGEE